MTDWVGPFSAHSGVFNCFHSGVLPSVTDQSFGAPDVNEVWTGLFTLPETVTADACLLLGRTCAPNFAFDGPGFTGYNTSAVVLAIKGLLSSVQTQTDNILIGGNLSAFLYQLQTWYFLWLLVIVFFQHLTIIQYKIIVVHLGPFSHWRPQPVLFWNVERLLPVVALHWHMCMRCVYVSDRMCTHEWTNTHQICTRYNVFHIVSQWTRWYGRCIQGKWCRPSKALWCARSHNVITHVPNKFHLRKTYMQKVQPGRPAITNHHTSPHWS